MKSFVDRNHRSTWTPISTISVLRKCHVLSSTCVFVCCSCGPFVYTMYCSRTIEHWVTNDVNYTHFEETIWNKYVVDKKNRIIVDWCVILVLKITCNKTRYPGHYINIKHLLWTKSKAFFSACNNFRRPCQPIYLLQLVQLLLYKNIHFIWPSNFELLFYNNVMQNIKQTLVWKSSIAQG